MDDFSLMQIRHSAPITAVDIVDSTRKTVAIFGKGFTNVVKVQFGGKDINPFIVLSVNEIQFILPPLPLDLSSPVRVIVEPFTTDNSFVKASSVDISADHVKASTGYSRVLQKFLKILLTKKGSNFFNPGEGTDLVDLSGSNNPDTALVDLSVDDAYRQMSSLQSSETLLPEEIITGVNVVSSYFDPRRASINIELEVETADGLARFTEVTV